MQAAQPSRTALRVALRRAAHQLVDAEPLILRDPFALRILGPEAAADLARTPPAARKPFSAAQRAWVVARARFAEDVLAQAVLAQATATQPALQYLVLGAGLDTFALRNPYRHVRVFEVDHPATQAFKRERLQAAALAWPPNAHLVPVDFEQHALPGQGPKPLHSRLLGQLLTAGFDPHLPTVTAWLGVVPYLSAEAFASTCHFLGSLPAGSAVVFDYTHPRAALPAVEQRMLDSLAARVAQAGEPFQLFFTPQTLAAELARHNFHVTQDLGTPDLNTLYFHHRPDHLHLRGTATRLCHAIVP